MPDLGSLTDEQREALKEHEFALNQHRHAVAERVRAQQEEQKTLFALRDIIYKVAGVT